MNYTRVKTVYDRVTKTLYYRYNKSYNVQIWVGLREHYSDIIHTYEEVQAICDDFIKFNSTCVSITKTEFRYTDGFEPGVIIGFINYPRYPIDKEEILSKAFLLAKRFMTNFKQEKISITTPTNTYMIEE